MNTSIVRRRLLCLSILALCLALVPHADRAHALDPTSSDPIAIMRAMASSQQPARGLSRWKVQIREGSSARERTFTLRTKGFSDARKTLILVESPGDIRNTGFLSVSYKQSGRADEQWVYLPKLRRVSRVATSSKSDAFVGSDFSISDLSLMTHDPDHFAAKLINSDAKVGDEPCWLIESVPRTAAFKSDIGYERLQLWVSKQKLVVLQFKGWLVDGKKTKYLKATDIRSEAGIWTGHRLQMRTLQGTEVLSESVMEILSIDNDAAGVTDADFTQQRLEQGV